MARSFEWDEHKNAENAAKHGVDFSEAAIIWDDPLCKVSRDEAHSTFELRFSIIGLSLWGDVLIASFTERREEHYRIISARKATRAERLHYEKTRW